MALSCDRVPLLAGSIRKVVLGSSKRIYVGVACSFRLFRTVLWLLQEVMCGSALLQDSSEVVLGDSMWFCFLGGMGNSV